MEQHKAMPATQRVGASILAFPAQPLKRTPSLAYSTSLLLYPCVCVGCYAAASRPLPAVCSLVPCAIHTYPRARLRPDHAQIAAAVVHICTLLVAARAPSVLIMTLQDTARDIASYASDADCVARFEAALTTAQHWFRDEVAQ